MSETRITDAEKMIIKKVENVTPHTVERMEQLVESDPVHADPASMQTVDDLLAQLSSESFEIVEKYFGLSGDSPRSASEIAAGMDLEADRVIHVIDQTLRQLRDLEIADERGRRVA